MLVGSIGDVVESPNRQTTSAGTSLMVRPAINRFYPFATGVGVAALLICGSVSNIYLYFHDGDGLDPLVLGGTLVALLAAIITWPRRMELIGAAMLLFWIVIVTSLRHEWVGTSYIDIARTTAVVMLSGSCVFIGAALRQNTNSAWLTRLMWLAILLALACAAAGIGPHLVPKNALGGTVFVLAIFAFSARYACRGEFTDRNALLALALIELGAFVTDYRVMMALGVAFAGGVMVYSRFRPQWARAVPLVAALLVAFGTVYVLTQQTRSGLYAEFNNEAVQYTGRQASSGRQTFWGPLVDAIVSGPATGYGPTKIARDVTGLQFSTHNSFLQVGLNFGYVGIAAVLLIFVTIIQRAVNATDTRAGALLSLYVAAVIVQNSSENVLFQNVFPTAAMTWLTIGFLAASTLLRPLNETRRRRSSSRRSQRAMA